MQDLSELTRRLILSGEALICAKEAMNRDHDRITVGQLGEIQRWRGGSDTGSGITDSQSRAAAEMSRG